MVEFTEIHQRETANLGENSPLLEKPVLCLILDNQPVRIAPQFPLDEVLSPAEMRIETRPRPGFKPLLITDQDIRHYALEDMELIDYYGPFKIYQPTGTLYEQAHTYNDRETFRQRRQNLVNWSHVPEMDLPLISDAQDVMKDVDQKQTAETRVFLSPDETKLLRSQLSDLLDQEIIGRLQAVPNLVQYPRELFEGLSVITTRLSLPGVHSSLQKFSLYNLEPLKLFTAKEVARLDAIGNDHPEDIFESIVGIEGFDIVLEMLKSQSEMLVEAKTRLSHKGVMIPFERFEGEPSYSPNASLEIQGKELVIKNQGNEYRFPMPAKRSGIEICFKGGLARVIAKIALGEDVSTELPVHDVDLVIFGKGGLPLKSIAEEYKTNVRDIERIDDGGYEKYCATRDSTFNEVLVSPEGVFISFNALSSMYQGYTQAADDNTGGSLFNKHIFTVYKPDLITGKNEATEQFMYVGKERFPSPVALSRMFKLLVDGKCDGIIAPEGIRKTDIEIYWLVVTRKILAEENPKVRQAKMERMLTLAKIVGSPYYTSLPEDQQDSPDAFVEKVKEAHPDFDMEGNLSDKDTILWVTQKLRNQIIRAYMNSIGKSEERSLQKILNVNDLDLEIITLPPMAAYGIEDPEKKEMDLVERRRAQKTREIISIFNSFSSEPSKEVLRAEETIRSSIAESYQSTDLRIKDLGRLYYIPVNERGRLLEAIKDKGFSAGADVSGVSFAVNDTKISCVFLEGNEPSLKTQLSLFEELYHASGLKIASRRGGGRVGYSVARFTKEGVVPTTLLEEGMAGLEWKIYKDQQMAAETETGKQLEQGIDIARRNHLIQEDGTIVSLREGTVGVAADFVTLIPDENAFGGLTSISSPSSNAGELLSIIVERCGVGMISLMRSARRGDVTSMREVAKQIEHTFGKGSYGLLLKTQADDQEGIEKLKVKFSSKQT